MKYDPLTTGRSRTNGKRAVSLLAEEGVVTSVLRNGFKREFSLDVPEPSFRVVSARTGLLYSIVSAALAGRVRLL